MHPAILPAALAFSAAAAMAVYVLLRRDKTDLHWLLLALLAALLIWTLGALCRFSVTSEAGLAASLRLVFLGVFATPPLWLLLAARYAGVRIARRDVTAALMLPSALAYLALLTNEAHRWMLREVSFEALAAGGRAWAGPAFWVFLAWAYVCVGGGVAIHLGTARRLVANDERRRGLVLAAAAAIPLVSSSIYLFRLVPVPFDLTPSALVFSLILLSTAVFRYQLLESLPLAHRDVIEHLHDGVVMASGAGIVLELNPAAEEMLGRTAAELRRRPLAEVVGPLAEGEAGRGLREALAHLEERRRPLVDEVRSADGRHLEIHAARVCHASGEPAGQYVVLRDRSAERRGELVARRIQRIETVATLAAGVAHEVNNPLAFIRANLTELQRLAELVERHRTGPAAKLAEELTDLPQLADEALDGIGRIERIVAAMRRLSSAPDEVFVAVDVNQVVADAVRLANLRNDPGVAVELHLDESLPRVDGSPERLAQALINLLVNARQALAGVPDGRIAVETRRENGAIAIRVSDNGPGIPEEAQERIFDPFFTTKPPDQGMGLGLSIAFDILRDHGGVLEVSSRPGEGAAFSARIPAR